MIEVDRVSMVGEVPAHARYAQHGLEEWVGLVSAELGIDRHVVDIAAVLDLAREAADGVGRPAAPLTAFLVGYAAGLAAGDGESDPATSELIAAQVGDLSRQWAGRPATSAPATSDSVTSTPVTSTPVPATTRTTPSW